MSDRKLKLGIIGYGTEGSMYGKFISEGMVENVEVTAVCDIDPEKLEIAKKVFPNAKFYECYKEMVDSGEVEGIVTCVPHYLHPEMAIYGLTHGVNVLNEKPAGVYTKQVKELNEVAKKSDKAYALFFNQRTNPLYRKLKKILDSGELGTIRRTNWIITTWWRPDAYYKQSDWRATWGGEGGGVLVNQAPHQLDLIQWMTGAPDRVYSSVQYGYQRDIVVDDQVHFLMEYDDGRTGVFVTGTNEIIGTDRLEIVCDGGKIVVDDSKKATIYRLKETENDLNARMTIDDVKMLFAGQMKFDDLFETEVIEENSVWGGQHCEVLRNFAAHILDGEELLANGAEGINGVRLANAVHLSSWLGKPVSVKDFDDDLYLKLLNEKIKEEGKFEERK